MASRTRRAISASRARANGWSGGGSSAGRGPAGRASPCAARGSCGSVAARRRVSPPRRGGARGGGTRRPGRVGAGAPSPPGGAREGKALPQATPPARLDGGEPLGRDLQHQLVVHLEEEAPAAPRGGQAAPDLQHG